MLVAQTAHAVTAGSEEYGIFVDNLSSGISVDTLFDTGDSALPEIFSNLAKSNDTVSNGTFDLTYKASIDGATISGVYTQIVTVTVATRS